MNVEIEWTEPAFAQIEAMPTHLAFEVIKRVDLLAAFPEMGVSLRSRYLQLKNCQQLIVSKSWRLVYEFNSETGLVYILAVQHCRQRLPTARELRRRAEGEHS